MPSRPPRSVNLARKIVSWFQKKARDLPWRRTRDPYAIWISEVMLQQTQVKTVIPYWQRWMQLFPNAQTLASAAEQQVLKAWEGLGYYSRARNLQKAARKILLEHMGTFPQSFDHVLQLPGVGRYTAGAICSIAFGQKTPILDGNVARVLSRIFMISGSPRESANQLWKLSTELVESSTHSSALNQGLMELGATVCLPREPICKVCPIRRDCGARLIDRVDQFPERREKLPVRERQFVAFIIRKNEAVLVRKRDGGVVNGGLWEFPNVEIAARDDAGETALQFGIACKPLTTIKHTITTNRITLRAFAGQANGNARTLAKKFAATWYPVADLDTLPFSSAHARLRNLVQGQGGTSNKVSHA